MRADAKYSFFDKQFKGWKEIEKVPVEEKHIVLGNRDKSVTVLL